MKESRTSTKKNNREKLYDVLDLLLCSEPSNKINYELESKFGTKGYKFIDKLDYMNVIQKLKSNQYSNITSNEGEYILKIQPKTINKKTGMFYKTKDFDTFRVEINGIKTIQKYCKTNDLKSIINFPNVTIMRKSDVFIENGTSQESQERVLPIEYEDFNFRITYKKEELLSKNSKIVKELVDNWNSYKKQFRYLNRVTFSKPDIPFKIDLSIVKSSSIVNKKMIDTYSIQESNVFENLENYEIECELSSHKLRENYIDDASLLLNMFEKNIKLILCGLQKTNFPVSLKEQSDVSEHYMALIEENLDERGNIIKMKEKKYKYTKLYPSNFVGPNSKTLQLHNIRNTHTQNILQEQAQTNITIPYSFCVTDKADGMRHLLYIHNNGRIYLIDTNMNIIFTGLISENIHYFCSLIDGELITHNKKGEYINKYMAFDVYFINTRHVYHYPFINTPLTYSKDKNTNFRLELLSMMVNNLQLTSVLHNQKYNNDVTNEQHGEKDIILINKRQQIITKPSSVSSQRTQFDENYFLKDKVSRLPLIISIKTFYPTFNILLEDVVLRTNKKSKTSIETETDLHDEEDLTLKIEKSKADDRGLIFDACKIIINQINDGLFDYETDGLIFTSTYLGVGATHYYLSNAFTRKNKLNKRITWEYSFKWKPSYNNTIDFLVTTKKNQNGDDEITPLFLNGSDMNHTTQFFQYKTLLLGVGYNEKRHGYLNPCQDVLDENYKDKTDNEDELKNKPRQFYPSNPVDPYAGICNIILEKDSNDNLVMFSEEREIIEDGMIIECRYDMDKETMWKWIPLRVRHDKTAEFRAGLNNFGNDYKVANDNWYSIHHPVTEKMITDGLNFQTIETETPLYDYDENHIYYVQNNKESKYTSQMRKFHNQFIKKMLIHNVVNKNEKSTLIDYACGKAGDLNKWTTSNIKFVLGIDIVRDNIENRLDGACARYLNLIQQKSSDTPSFSSKQTKNIPSVIFLHGDSTLNIQTGQSFFNSKDKHIIDVLFGKKQKELNHEKIGKAVVRQYGVVAEGFDISSIQFALHYMFQNKEKFYNFICNISECTKLNGYFIGTCYDGLLIFNKLKRLNKGDDVVIYKDDVKIWQIIKDYENKEFVDEEECLGMKIKVYQDSIGQLIDEYLVNFNFLNRILENYGFVLLNETESKQLGFQASTGLFSDLYNKLITEYMTFNYEMDKNIINYKGIILEQLQNYEKEISFLNRYFVYKKIRNIDSKKITNNFLSKINEDIILQELQKTHSETSISDEPLTTPTPLNVQQEQELQQLQQLEQLQQPQQSVQQKSISKPKEPKQTKPPRIKKLNKKIKLIVATEGIDEMEM